MASASKKYGKYTGFYYFYIKETSRFMKVWGQTIMGPLVNSFLYLIVFSLIARSNNLVNTHGNEYSVFLLPGLIMLSVINASFSNSSSSIIISKINSSIQEIFMAPLTATELVLAYSLGSFTRALLVTVITYIVAIPIVGVHVHNIFWILYFLFVSSMIMGALGVIAGIVCIKFDQLANFTTLVITPFSMLSGTFYSTAHFSPIIKSIIHCNPFFYMIDGFRYGVIGHSDFSIITEAIVLFVIMLIIIVLAQIMWNKGYRIKN